MNVLTFVDFNAGQLLPTHGINAVSALDEVYDNISSVADGDLSGDALEIRTPIADLKTVSIFAAYSNVPFGHAGGTANLYLTSRDSKAYGAVGGFILEFPETEERNAWVWILEDASNDWNKVVRDLHTIFGMHYPERVTELLDWKEEMDIKIRAKKC